MAKFKPYNYDQLVMLPISLEDQLEPGTLEYTINELVEKHIDLSVFEDRYQNDETGATAFNPKVLLKVILFAYSRGMISSRQIERACAENILCDEMTPVNLSGLEYRIRVFLGMAIEKSRLDAESKKISIIQERNMLSSELHDSLAQTLASLKYQVANLDDSINGGDELTAEREIAQRFESDRTAMRLATVGAALKVAMPPRERAKLIEVPERVAKLVREELPLPSRTTPASFATV